MENPNVEKEEEDKQFAIIKGLAKEAYKLLDSHQFPKAEAKLKELLEKDPHNTYGLVGMGDLFLRKKIIRTQSNIIINVSKRILLINSRSWD